LVWPAAVESVIFVLKYLSPEFFAALASPLCHPRKLTTFNKYILTNGAVVSAHQALVA